MEYYFKCKKDGHPMNWFLYNFDRLDDTLIKSEQDIKHRKNLREQTKNLVEQELNEY